MSPEALLLILGFSASTLGFYFYIKDIFGGSTKPHVFTWLIWAVMSFIGFGIQITHEGGIGSYIILYFAIITVGIFLYALKIGEKTIAKIDYLFLFLAGVALIFWLILDQAIISVLLLLAIDYMAYMPTFRKSFMHPNDETALLYVLVNVGYIVSILTFDTLLFENYGYPAGLFLINTVFVAFLFIRRKQLKI